MPSTSAKVPKPPFYSGERDPRVIDTWLKRIEVYLRTNDVPENGQVDIASGYIQNEAFDWFETNPDLCDSFANFKTNLRSHFVPANFESVLHTQFQSTKQGQKQVSAYSLELETMAAKLPNFVSPHVLRQHFVNGLKPSIRMHVMAYMADDSETFKKLVARAMRLEEALAMEPEPPRRAYPRQYTPTAVTQQHQQWRPTSTTPSIAPSSSVSRTTQANRVSVPPPPGLNTRLGRLSEEERAYLRSVGGCFACRKIGHTAMECPTRHVKPVKQEVNVIASEELSGSQDSDIEMPDYQPSYSIVPPIIVPLQLENGQTVDALADSGCTSDLIQSETVQRLNLKPRIASKPSLLHQPLSKTTVVISKELESRISIPTIPFRAIKPTVFKVAPIRTYEAIIGLPFLVNNDLLIDAKNRKLVPRSEVTTGNQREITINPLQPSPNQLQPSPNVSNLQSSPNISNLLQLTVTASQLNSYWQQQSVRRFPFPFPLAITMHKGNGKNRRNTRHWIRHSRSNMWMSFRTKAYQQNCRRTMDIGIISDSKTRISRLTVVICVSPRNIISTSRNSSTNTLKRVVFIHR